MYSEEPLPPKTTWACDVVPEPVRWLWPGRIPLGKLVVLDGDPAAGKSTLALDLAARVTTGATWPDGTQGGQPRSVLLLSAEDGLADTITPRLVAAGADLGKVLALQAVAIPAEVGWQYAFPSLARDVRQLSALLEQHDFALCIVDVLMAYLGGRVDSHKDADIRSVLAPLAEVAEKHQTTIILIRHLNKSGNGSAIYRGGGSIGIIGAARAAYLIARDPNEPTRRIIAVTKSNLSVEPPALAYRLVDAPEHGCARVEWETEPLDGITAAMLLREPADELEREETNAAEAWLTDYLVANGGDATTSDLRNAVNAAGFEWNTVRKHLPKIAKSFRSGFGTSQQYGWKLST